MMVLKLFFLSIGWVSLLVFLLSFIGQGLQYKVCTGLAALTALFAFMGYSGLSELKHLGTAEGDSQIVDLDFIQGSLSKDQKQMIDLAISEGFSVKAVPIVVEGDEHLAVILGEPKAQGESQSDAGRMILDKFNFVGVENLKPQDLPLLTEHRSLSSKIAARTLALISTPEKFFKEYYRQSTILTAFSRYGWVVEGNDVLDYYREKVDLTHNQSPSLRPVTCLLENGSLSSYQNKSNTASEQRDLRLAANIEQSFKLFPKEELMLVIVNNSQLISLGQTLTSKIPKAYVLKSLRAAQDKE